MTNPAKAKGSQFERDVVAYLREHGFPGAERRYGAGAQADRGDLQGFRRPLVVECKALAKITLSSIVDETERERINARADVGVAVVKRRNKPVGAAYVVLPLEIAAYLLALAGF